MANEQNLTPFSATENRERTVELARMAGIASGKVRRARKSFREEIKIALGSRIQPSHAKYAEIKRMVRSLGLLDEGDPTNQLLVIAGMLQRAQKDPAAAAFLRDTIGEKPKDEMDVAVNAPPIVIGIHDPAYIEAEREKQDRMLKDMGEGGVVDVASANGMTEPAPLPPTPLQTDEKPPVAAPRPQNGGRSSDAQQANVTQPCSSAPQPSKPPKRPMTRAEAVAAMEAERKAKGQAGIRAPAKPVFVPSGFNRRR